MHDLPLVYVAGPYSSPDPVQNTHDAVHWGNKITDTGKAAVIVPHITLLWHAISPKPYEHWLALDLAHLARCDALFRFPGASSGADKEVGFAVDRGIPVFFAWEDLALWLAT